MNLAKRIAAFSELGKSLSRLTNEEIDDWYFKATTHNNWFTRDSVENAVQAIANMLSSEKIETWLSAYQLKDTSTSKKIAVVMAGNIPLVGFHDFLSVLISGHHLQAKLSSQDPILPRLIAEKLISIEPEFESYIQLTEDRLEDFDAVIATGSNNSARYFEQYFGKYPHIIRKNRTSVAVLDGTETQQDYLNLGKDLFQYYGLGCRNVSKLFVPEQFDFKPMLDSLQDFASLNDHHKWNNNYDYNKSIYLVNGDAHFDSGFFLVKESSDLVSPISVLFYQNYKSEHELQAFLDNHQHAIQCKVGRGQDIDFGFAQQPELWDYADGVDTLKFLTEELV